jgi:hypothetical protein
MQMRAVDTGYREWRRQARSRGLQELQERSAALWERTALFRVHEHWSIPGLFQTRAYALASMEYWTRLLDLPGDPVAAADARFRRQRILRQAGHRFIFLLSEQVLYARVGSDDVMAEQLDRVITVMALPNVSIGIIPFAAGIDSRTQTAFSIFDESLVRVETLTAGLDISRPEEITLYATVFEQMRVAAVFGRTAKALITKAREELLQHPATS